MKNRRKIRGRKIQTKGVRETVDKRNKTIAVNKEITAFIYMQINQDFSYHFALNKSKVYVLEVLEKWWVEPHNSGKYSTSGGVYNGVCWAYEHLHKTSQISFEEKQHFMQTIQNVDERKDRFIRHWNPKHAVGGRVWKELLEFVEKIKKLPEEKVEEIVDLAKKETIKDINKTLNKN